MKYQIVSQKLQDLGWTWTHPRVSNYIFDLSAIHKTTFRPKSLPAEHYTRLQKIIECCERINLYLIENKANWSDVVIADFFNKHSAKDNLGNPSQRLLYSQWLELENVVRREIICPF